MKSFKIILTLIFLFSIFPFLAKAQTQISVDIIPTEFNEGTGINIRVSADGKRLVFGSRLATVNGNALAGAARVYENTNGTWSQLGQILKGDSEFEFFGETVDISDSGDRIVIGSDSQARVYFYDGSQWAPMGQDLSLSNMNNVREIAFSTGGEILAILYRLTSGDFELHIYKLIGNSWELMGEAFTVDLDRDFTLDGSGTRVAVHFDNVSDFEEVRVYDFINGSWQQIGDSIKAQPDYSYDNSEISADGQKLMIFSGNNTSNGISGYLKTYDFENSSWVENTAQLNFEIENTFGTSMASSSNGKRLAFATSDDNYFDDYNFVKVFELVENQWQQAGEEVQIWAHDEQLPNYVDITPDGTKVAMASLLSGPGVEEGVIRAFDFTSVLASDDLIPINVISLVPNPTEGGFKVNMGKSHSKISTTIFNVLGEIIASKEFINTDRMELNLHGGPGIYLVKIISSDGASKTLKILKQN